MDGFLAKLEQIQVVQTAVDSESIVEHDRFTEQFRPGHRDVRVVFSDRPLQKIVKQRSLDRSARVQSRDGDVLGEAEVAAKGIRIIPERLESVYKIAQEHVSDLAGSVEAVQHCDRT